MVLIVNINLLIQLRKLRHPLTWTMFLTWFKKNQAANKSKEDKLEINSLVYIAS